MRADVRLLAKTIGYVMGAGDEVPQALQQLGADVMLLSAEDLAGGDLSRFDAIVTGVRAYNVRADLRANQGRLFDYVKNGGTLGGAVQRADGRNPFGGETSSAGEYRPLSDHHRRERVTVEEAPVQFLNPASPLLHQPNEITANDFEGWVQERGLYFASKWDEHYQPRSNRTTRGEAADRRQAVHALRQRRVYFHGVFLVPRVAGGRAWRVSLLREYVERRKDAVSGEQHRRSRTAEDEPPPILGTWRRVYVFVLFYLALLIAGFYVSLESSIHEVSGISLIMTARLGGDVRVARVSSSAMACGAAAAAAPSTTICWPAKPCRGTPWASPSWRRRPAPSRSSPPPARAYVDGMRFVQFYFGLPIAMVILSATAVPIFHRANVYTAYEYLEQRFDAKTRALASLDFSDPARPGGRDRALCARPS